MAPTMIHPDITYPDHQPLIEFLQEQQIHFTIHHHPPLPTVAESLALRGNIPGLHLKSLFLRDQREKMWLVVVPENKNVDLKILPQKIGSGRLSFGSAERLWQYLGVKPGSVSPLAAINDRQRQCVAVIFDHELLKHPLINCHPLRNDITISLTQQDLLKFMRVVHHIPSFIE